MPPNVAQKRSAFSSRLARTTSPLASSTVIASTQVLKQPWAWWALPCTSLAMQPPTVTNLVPGVIIGNQPRGAKSSMICSRLTPASQVRTPAAGVEAEVAVEPPQAEHLAARVQRGVAVAAAEAARDGSPVLMRPLAGEPGGDLGGVLGLAEHALGVQVAPPSGEARGRLVQSAWILPQAAEKGRPLTTRSATETALSR